MTARKAESGSEMTEPEQVAKVISPPTAAESVASQRVDHHAAPAPQLKPQWDEPELDPMKRHSIADDPDGSKNAARLAEAIDRHQVKAIGG